MHYTLRLGCATLHALPSGALFWPEQELLCVSDMHLGKPEPIFGRSRPLLTPYGTHATLINLEADVDQTHASRVICLGASFDEMEASAGRKDGGRLRLARIIAGRHWTWIKEDHNPGPLDVGGSHQAQITIKGLIFRHVTDRNATQEISGHYQPSATLAGRVCACFLADERRIILPGYGGATTGRRCQDHELYELMGPHALAVLTGPRAVAIPMQQRHSILGNLVRQNRFRGGSAS